MYLIKGKNKLPTVDWIYAEWYESIDELFDYRYEDAIEDLRFDWSKKSKEERLRLDEWDWSIAETGSGKQNFHDFVRTVFKEFSKLLSTMKRISRTDVERTVRENLKK